MHAVGYRPHLSVMVLAIVTFSMLAMVAAPRARVCGRARVFREAPARIECAHTRAYSMRLADAWYRGKRFDAAAQTLRDAAKCEPVRIAEELHVIASFYHQLDRSYRAGVEGGPSTATIEHFTQAIQFDAMLGAAHAGELELRRHRVLSAVGPQ